MEPSFRRSSHIVCFWRAGAFVFYNYATRLESGATPLACDILEYFSDWKTLTDLCRSRPDVAEELWREFVEGLVEVSLLQRSDVPPHVTETQMAALDRWNPEAGFFHARTKSVKFIDNQTATRAARDQALTWPMPSAVKSYPQTARIELPMVIAECEIERSLIARRTWRQFGVGPVSLVDFSRVIGFTARIQEWVHVEGQGDVALKTSPSGGARHPIEVYIIAMKLEGIPNGLYHYAADAHALELLRSDIGAADIPRYFPHSEWYADCAAVFLFTAMFERDLWRYAYSRAYRAPFVEVGHLCQSLCLLATAYGLAPFVLMGLADDAIEADLGIDGITESVVYAAGIGVRPEGRADASEPPGFQRPNRRRNPIPKTGHPTDA